MANVYPDGQFAFGFLKPKKETTRGSEGGPQFLRKLRKELRDRRKAEPPTPAVSPKKPRPARPLSRISLPAIGIADAPAAEDIIDEEMPDAEEMPPELTPAMGGRGREPSEIDGVGRQPNPIETLLQVERQGRGGFLWTCENLLWIKPKNEAIVRLRLKWAQRYIAEHHLMPAWDQGQALGLAVLKPRRVGISTLFAAWSFHKLRFFPGMNVLMTAHRDDTVDDLHQMVHRFHNNLPPELQPPKERSSRKELAYSHPLEGMIRVLSAGYHDIGKGKGVNIAHLSEVAEYGDPDTIMTGVNEAVPDAGRTLLVLESTARVAGDWWHEFWLALGKRQQVYPGRRQWQRVFLPWFADPEHWSSAPHGWELTGDEVEMQQRFKLATEQLVWYRMKREEMEQQHPGRGIRMLHAMYPSTAQEAFVAAGDGIFPEEIMDRLEAQQRRPKLAFEVRQVGPLQAGLQPRKLSDARTNDLFVWEEPKPGCQYAIGVDVSEGVGRDASAIEVLRMPSFVQVAEWADNHTSTAHLASIVAAVGRYYGQAGNRPIVNVEVTGPGIDTNSRLQDLYADEPFDLYIWEPFDRLGAVPVGPASRTGWYTSHLSKQILISTANSLLQEGWCELPSGDLQSDMRQMQEVHIGTYATGGCDYGMAWLLAVVAAWRKIARFSFGGMTAAMGVPEKPVVQEPWKHDVGWEAVLAGTIAGETSERWGRDDVPWEWQ